MSLTQDYVTVPGQLFCCVSFVGPELPQKNDLMGLKIRGCFHSREDAGEHCKRLQKDDASVDIYVVEMYKWLLIPPDASKIDNTQYQEEKLQEIMTKYKENQSQAASMFEKRKRDMSAKPQEGEFPYIDPSDENSKYYTKPDVPPIPHPAELIDGLKLEFPDLDMTELVKIADQRIAVIIEERKLPAVVVEVINE